MEEDFLKELGYVALAARLKRVSDKMIHSGRAMYKALGIDIEPNWYFIFKILQQYRTLSVTEIANKLQLAHPSVIHMMDKMAGKGYLEIVKSANDARKQMVSLTLKAKKNLPKFEKIWEAGASGIEKMMGGAEILPILEHLEVNLQRSSFEERTLLELD